MQHVGDLPNLWKEYIAHLLKKKQLSLFANP